MENQRERIHQAVSTYFSNNAPDYLKKLSDGDINHIINIGTSILCTKWDIGPVGGGFVNAFLSNKLKETYNSADQVNKLAIPFYLQLVYNMDYIS
jgi:hypothetical protein